MSGLLKAGNLVLLNYAASNDGAKEVDVAKLIGCNRSTGNMPFHSCTPTNSSPSEETRRSFPDDGDDPIDFEGIPRKCICGSPAKLKASNTSQYPRRNSIVCEDKDEKGVHTFKWWDEAVMEDVGRLKFREFPTVKIALKFLRNDDNAISETLSNDFESANREIAKLANLQEHNEKKIARLENLVCKKGRLISSSELRAMVAWVMVVAIVSIYLNL